MAHERGAARNATRAVFLHGYPGFAQEFMAVAGSLSCDCVLIEMPWLDCGIVSLTVEDVVDSLAKHLGPEPVHIIGHDLGAAIGWHYVNTHFETTLSFTMIGMPRLDDYARSASLLHKNGFLNYRLELERHNPETQLPLAPKLTPAEAGVEKALGWLAKSHGATNPPAIVSLYRDFARRSVPSRPKIAPPLAIIHGADDPYFPRSLWSNASSGDNDNITVSRIENAGHWPHITHTTRCADAIASQIRLVS